MKNLKLFIGILFIVAIILFFIDIPFSIKFSGAKLKVPIINKTLNLNFDSSKININLGFFKIQKDLNYRLGLDLQGGTRLIYQVDMKEIPETERDNAFESARSVIDRRINFFGVTEPNIQSIKLAQDYRIIIELPGATNVDQALDLIGKTAQLTFWEEGRDKIATEEAFLYPFGLTNIFQNEPLKTKLTGKDLKSARVAYGSKDGTPQVQLIFTPQGSKLFAEITQRNVGKPVAIVLDNVVISAPVVQQPILNGDAVITCGSTSCAS